MKLTKLPDNCDANLMVQEESRKKFAVCPCCGESRSHFYPYITGGIELEYLVPSKGYYGPARGDFWGRFLPSRWHNWRIDSYRCHTCGAEWESDPYPIDLRNS